MSGAGLWAHAWVASKAHLARAPLPAASPALLWQVADADAGAASAERLLRRRLLAALGASVLGVHPDAIRLWAGDDGIRRIMGHGDVFASVASRPGWVAVALAGRPVGIDVELASEAAAAPALVAAGLAGPPGPGWHPPAGIWAAKEAYLKSLGQGLAAADRGWRLGPSGKIAGDGLPPGHAALLALPGAVAALVVDGLATPPMPLWLDRQGDGGHGPGPMAAATHIVADED